MRKLFRYKHTSSERRQSDLRLLKTYDGKILPSSVIKKLFGFSPTTYIADTWVFRNGHMKRVPSLKVASYKLSFKPFRRSVN